MAFAVIIQLCLFCGNITINRTDYCRNGATAHIVVAMRTHAELIKELKTRGYTVEHSSRGHYKVRRPNGSYAMTMSHSPKDRNSVNSARRLAKRLGLLEA